MICNKSLTEGAQGFVHEGDLNGPSIILECLALMDDIAALSNFVRITPKIWGNVASFYESEIQKPKNTKGQNPRHRLKLVFSLTLDRHLPKRI